MASWILGGFTFPDADAPWYDSSMPEEQEDEHIEDTPIGANAADATIITYVASPSVGAESGEPFLLRGECSAASKASLLALRRTTNTLKTPFDTTGKSAYLKRIRFKRWDGNNRAAVAGAGERFLYWLWFLGR